MYIYGHNKHLYYVVKTIFSWQIIDSIEFEVLMQCNIYDIKHTISNDVRTQ